MKLAVPLVSLACACAACASPPAGSRSTGVRAETPEGPEAGVTVISHAPTGEVIDQVAADGIGYAALRVDDDSLVSVVFPGVIAPSTETITVVTVPVTPAGTDVVVRGPARPPAPLVVGRARITAPALADATHFLVAVGCAEIRVTQLPATFDITACSMGRDNNLDVLVRGYANDTLVGYAAARVPMANNIAEVAIGSWHTNTLPVPIVLDGVAPVIEWTLEVDGLPFLTEAAGSLYSDLVVDAIHVDAHLDTRMTSRVLAAAPPSIEYRASDFLVPVTDPIERVDDQPLVLRWTGEVADADAVHVLASWNAAGKRVAWRAELAPVTTTITFPLIGDDLAAAVAPTTLAPEDVVLRFVDTTETQVRTSSIAGLR